MVTLFGINLCCGYAYSADPSARASCVWGLASGDASCTLTT